jgi:two-component system, probable response regulator PhcQ
MKILLLDDEPFLIKAMQRELRVRPEWTVHTFTSVNEALGAMRTQPYDVIISDFKMPEFDGICVLQWALQIQPQAFRILLTGYADHHILADAINKAKVYRYMAKPWSAEGLIALLDECAADGSASHATRTSPAH